MKVTKVIHSMWKEWNNFVGGTHYAPSLFESTPGLYLRPLIIEAFNSIGYTVISDFFDTDLFSKLVIGILGILKKKL